MSKMEGLKGIEHLQNLSLRVSAALERFHSALNKVEACLDFESFLDSCWLISVQLIWMQLEHIPHPQLFLKEAIIIKMTIQVTYLLCLSEYPIPQYSRIMKLFFILNHYST